MAPRTGRRAEPIPAAGYAVPMAQELRKYKERSDKTYDQLAVIARYTKTALSVAASGKKLPSWDVVEAFIRACEGTDAEVRDVRVIWEAARLDGQGPRGRREHAVEGQLTRVASPVCTYLAADPRKILDLGGFNVALEQIRVELGLSVNEIILRSKLPTPAGRPEVQLRRTHVYDVLSGRARPSDLFVELFLIACGMPARQRRAWIQQFSKLKEEERRASEALAVLQKKSQGDGNGRAREALSRLQSAQHEPTVYSAMRIDLDFETATGSDDLVDAGIIDSVVHVVDAEIVDDVVDAEIVGCQGYIGKVVLEETSCVRDTNHSAVPSTRLVVQALLAASASTAIAVLVEMLNNPRTAATGTRVGRS